MLSNRTQELWSWTRETFYKTLLDQKYDLNENYFFWLAIYSANKIVIVFEAFVAFAFTSFVNGLKIRIYLVLASVFVFPLLFFIRHFTHNGLSN